MQTMFRFTGSKKEETEFDREWSEYRETVEDVKALQKAMRSHMQLTKEFVASSAALGIQIASFYQNTAGASRARAYGQLHCELERIQVESLERLFDSEVDMPTNVLLLQYPDIISEVKGRKKLLSDAEKFRKRFENKKQELADTAAAKLANKPAGLLSRRRKSETELNKELSERKQRYDECVEEAKKKTEWLREQFHDMRERKSKGEVLEGPVSGLVACQFHLNRESAKRVDKIRKLFVSSDVYMRTLQRYDQELIKGITLVQDLAQADGLEFGRVLKSSTPKVICDCIAFIRQGIEIEGLFRIPGNRQNVQLLQNAYDKGENAVLDKYAETIDIHDVCSLLKHYLAKLPEPLIPYEQYEELLQLIRHNNAKSRASVELLSKEALIERAVEITQKIKGSRKGLLGFILNFLHDVAKYKEMNQMTANNLATCVVPVICKTQNDTQQLPVPTSSKKGATLNAKDLKAQATNFQNLTAIANLAPSIAVISLLIENARRLPVPTEEAINKNTSLTIDVRALLKRKNKLNTDVAPTKQEKEETENKLEEEMKRHSERRLDELIMQSKNHGREARQKQRVKLNKDSQIGGSMFSVTSEVLPPGLGLEQEQDTTDKNTTNIVKNSFDMEEPGSHKSFAVALKLQELEALRDSQKHLSNEDLRNKLASNVDDDEAENDLEEDDEQRKGSKFDDIDLEL